MDILQELNISKQENGIKFCVKVIPGSSKTEIVGVIDGCVKIKLNSPPIEGRANEECIKFLSKQLGIAKTSIKIVSGEKSKNKTLSISGESDKLVAGISKLISLK